MALGKNLQKAQQRRARGTEPERNTEPGGAPAEGEEDLDQPHFMCWPPHSALDPEGSFLPVTVVKAEASGSTQRSQVESKDKGRRDA